MVVSIEIVGVRSVYVAGVWITESGLVVSIISIVVVVHILSISLRFSLSLSLENMTVVEIVVDGGVRISSVSIGLILTGVGSVSRKGVEYPVVLSISLWFSLSLSLENSTIVEVVIDGGVRISSVSIGLILTGVGSESREGVVCAVVLSVSLRFSLSLTFAPEMMYSRVCM